MNNEMILKELVNIAIKNNIPLLGICRGFHYINIHFGGSIYHNIKDHVKKDHILTSKNKFLNNTSTNLTIIKLF